MRILLSLFALLVPRSQRPRWREEWRAELEHGGWRMLPGAVPDAWAMRRLASGSRLPASGSRRSHPFHALDQDVRYAFRTLGTGRSFTLGVIGSLAIGIGATTTAFAMVNATLFRSFPSVRGQEDLVRVMLSPGRGTWILSTWDDYRVLGEGIPALESLSIAHDASFAVAAGGSEEPRTLGGLVVSHNYFDVLGITPALGRFFLPDDEADARQTVVVSHSYWQRYLGGDPSALQRSLDVNGAALPIIGVAPEGFVGPRTRGDADIWITFALSDLVFRNEDGEPIQARDAEPFRNTMIGRLKPSATIEQASAQAAALAQPLAEARNRGLGNRELLVRVEPLRIADPERFAMVAVGLMVVPLIVLAIACVNAANLLLARASQRSVDWLVRLALGASRWRLIRQLLVESLLLALAGAALGLVLCFWAASYVQVLAFPTVVVDANVVLFVVGAAVATALVFGLGPALSVTRAAVSRAPEGGRFLRGPFGSRSRAALVMLQAALCLGLLATGAQFMKTLQAIWEDGLPEPRGFLTVSLDVDPLRYGRDQADTFYSELLSRVEELPGVEAAALTDRSAARMLAGGVTSWGGRVAVPGVPDAPRDVHTSYATAGFFEAMGVQLVQGRTFTSDEHRWPSRAVVVNETFVKRAFGESALGRIVTLAPDREAGTAAVEAMVVGVIAAPSHRPLFTLPMVFYPAPLTHEPALDLLVRVEGDAAAIAPAIRTIVSSIDPRLPLGHVATGEDLRRQRNIYDYTLARTVSVLGLLALILAAAGLYGVVSYMVTLRQKEIGIRMALGAGGGSVLRLVVRHSIVPVLAGCVLGAVGAVVAGALIRSRLYGVSPVDPVAFGGATLLLLLTMLVASLIPARHASRVDPITVLRQE